MRKTGLIRLFTLSILFFALFIFANPHALKARAEAPSGSAAGNMLILTYREWPEGVPFPASLSGVATLSAVTGNGYELTPPELAGLTLSYLEGDNWSELTSEKAKDLPADTRYRFDFTYQNVKISDIIASGGKMVYKGLPEWFTPSGSGILQYGGEDVGRIEKIGDDIVITFNSDWLETHKNNTVGGTFRVSGSVDWHELPPGGGSASVPGLDLDLRFENDLAQKYGLVDIEKEQTRFITGPNGEYYLEYTLKVTSRDTAVIPDVAVRDLFDELRYVAGYVGVSGAATVLPGSASGLSPWEARDTKVSAGTLRTDGDELVWEIGDMQPGETRTLTYCVRIADAYVDELTNNPIVNRAQVFSDEYLKDDDWAAFMPDNDVTIAKKAVNRQIDNNGNGTITYEVTITADKNNTFTLENLTFKDGFPAELAALVSGGENGRIDVSVNGTLRGSVAFENGSFSVDGITLAPGESVTLTYTVRVHDLAGQNGDVALKNTASAVKGGRTLCSATYTETFRQRSWIEKSVGDQLASDERIDIAPGKVYAYNGGNPIEQNNPPASFDVPKGSVYYQVDLSPNGQWDLSDVRLEDALGSPFLQYAGYVRVERIAPNGEVETVWLDVNELTSFSFTVGQLFAQPAAGSAYRLSYYAKLKDAGEIIDLKVSNDFSVSGVVRDGNGNVIFAPGAKVTASGVVKGGYNVNYQKYSWYYEPSPVYKTPHVDDGDYEDSKSKGYSKSAFESDYENGAIYWIIRVEGKVPAGKFKGQKEGTTYEGFRVADAIAAGNIAFARDGVICAFVADKELDIPGTYSDIRTLMASGIKMLKGTTINHKYFAGKNTDKSYDYHFFAENNKLDGVVFGKEYELGDDKAMFIVLRTRLTKPLPSMIPWKPGTALAATYSNTVKVYTDGTESAGNTATYTYIPDSSLYKESKGAYVYIPDNPQNERFSNVSNRQGGDWKPLNQVDEDALPGKGIYAAWLLNINHLGAMSGTADIADELPAGMELVYVDVNNMGPSIVDNPSLWPKTETIPELNRSRDWEERQKTCTVSGQSVNTITYYNKGTGELRWRISNLTYTQDGARNEINLRIICKVTDYELFMNQARRYENIAKILDENGNPLEMETADVTIYFGVDKSLLPKDINGRDVDIELPLEVNRLPFEIGINRLGEDMFDGDTLPTLVDELSPSLRVLEETIQVKADGQPFTGFTYTVRTINGRQILYVSSLPDGVPITIYYEAMINGAPETPVDISNKAYWAGYTPPDEPQVSYPDVSFEPDGDLFVYNAITVTVYKVDDKTHSKKLDGAVFALYEVNGPGKLGKRLRKGTSGSDGVIRFVSGAGQERLEYNKVYCLREEAAPAGYIAGTEQKRCYYFIIVPPESEYLDPDKMDALSSQYKDYHFEAWYSDDDYRITIANDKGSIGVDKVFLDADGRAYTPESGTYRFGLFTGALELLETIAIEYTGGGKANYYVNGVPMASPEFIRYDPDMYYHIYELDDDDQPIVNNSLAQLGNMTYVVTYAADEVSARSGMVRVGNRLVPEPGSISVSKTVESPDASDKALRFAFRIDLTLNGRPLPGAYRYTGSRFVAGVSAPDDGAVESGGVVSLSHGQTITLEPALPPDTVVTVTELGLAEDGDVPADAFLPSYTIVGSAVSTSGTGVSASAVISAGSAQGDQIHFRFKNLRDEDADVPMTGDNSHLELFVALAVLSMISMAFFRKKMVS